MKIRINKYLSSLGIASRRAIDEMINQKQITINNVIAFPGQKIDPNSDQIHINHQLVKTQTPKLEYILLNKPKGYLSSTRGFKNQKTILDLIHSSNRLYPIGRLDKDSQGLIILTNDGDLTQKLTHPRYHIPKTYHITILGKVQNDQLQKLKSGIPLEDGLTQPAQVKIIKENYPHNTILEIILYEGRKRQIRRMCAHLHLFIQKLERVAIGPIQIQNLNLGKSRNLTSAEIKQLLTQN